MKNFEYKEEYVTLNQKQKSKINNFKSSIKNKLIILELKHYYKETYLSFRIGNVSTYLTKEMVDKFNLYINSCVNNILIDKKKYPLTKNPKISVIIPIYNGGKYLHYSLRSIQNQKMKDLEIIIINDCSTNNSLTIIEKI